MGDPVDVLLEEYSYLIKELNKLDIGYIKLARFNPAMDPQKRGTKIDVFESFGHLIKNPVLIGNSGFKGPEAEEFIKRGDMSAVAFGLPFIVNPDLPSRLFNGFTLRTKLDFGTFYTNDAEGYTTYESYKA
jgi:N-ethylmaleimide reductase